MITRDPAELRPFFDPALPPFGPATAPAAFLVVAEGFARAEQSPGDNRYMAAADAFDAASALAEHRALQAALAADLPVIVFPGDPATPDAVFPNNVFATAPGRSIIGRMRHPVRRRAGTGTRVAAGTGRVPDRGGAAGGDRGGRWFAAAAAWPRFSDCSAL